MRSQTKGVDKQTKANNNNNCIQWIADSFPYRRAHNEMRCVFFVMRRFFSPILQRRRCWMFFCRPKFKWRKNESLWIRREIEMKRGKWRRRRRSQFYLFCYLRSFFISSRPLNSFYWQSENLKNPSQNRAIKNKRIFLVTFSLGLFFFQWSSHVHTKCRMHFTSIWFLIVNLHFTQTLNFFCAEILHKLNVEPVCSIGDIKSFADLNLKFIDLLISNRLSLLLSFVVCIRFRFRFAIYLTRINCSEIF